MSSQTQPQNVHVALSITWRFIAVPEDHWKKPRSLLFLVASGAVISSGQQHVAGSLPGITTRGCSSTGCLRGALAGEFFDWAIGIIRTGRGDGERSAERPAQKTSSDAPRHKSAFFDLGPCGSSRIDVVDPEVRLVRTDSGLLRIPCHAGS
jgi:hypothetical protein